MKKNLIILLITVLFLTSCSWEKTDLTVIQNQDTDMLNTQSLIIPKNAILNLLQDIQDNEIKQLFEEYIKAKNEGDIQKEFELTEKIQILKQVKNQEFDKAQEEGNIELIKSLRNDLRIIWIIQR